VSDAARFDSGVSAVLARRTKEHPPRSLSEGSESKRSHRQDTSPGAAEDDFDARPGSTASLLRTVVGLYLRPLGGWISTADLVQLAGDLGIPASRARTGIARLKQRGLLTAERTDAAGYRLDPAALPMLERGDRRIFDIRIMSEGEQWCLISYSIPESRRGLRHRLRRGLQWLGAGAVSPALWILPGHLADEAEDLLRALDVRDTAVLFRTDAPIVAGSLAEAVSDWWDLTALRAEHERFQAAVSELPDAATDRDAFAAYVRLIDAWRTLPYLDPGLPAELLPADWPGAASFSVFAELSSALAARAMRHVSTSIGQIGSDPVRDAP
jgi:phenylacetic acid degradation operon negative regulatory protein